MIPREKKYGRLFHMASLVGFALIMAVWVVSDGGAFPTSESNMDELEGVIRLVGSEPFTRLVISTDEDRDYYIENDSARERFSKYIGQRVRIRGVTDYRESSLAGTDSEVKEYYIRDVELVE